MLGQPDYTYTGDYDNTPSILRFLAQVGANLIIGTLVGVGLVTSIDDANSRDLMVGSEQQSLVIICREDYDVEDLLFAQEQGNFDDRLAHLTEHRRCGRYFTAYKIVGLVSSYNHYTIVRLLHERGIGYTYTDFDVVAENLQYIADTGTVNPSSEAGEILVVGKPFANFAGLHACASLDSVEHLLSILDSADMAAFHTQLETYIRLGHCGSYAGRFAIRERIAAKAYTIDGDSHQFTTVAILHEWNGRVSQHYTFTDRRVMTPEEYAEYLKAGETYDS